MISRDMCFTAGRALTCQICDCHAGAYRLPTAADIPQDLNVTLLDPKSGKQGSVRPQHLVHSSKNVGEAPLFSGCSVYYAVKQAIYAAREEHGLQVSHMCSGSNEGSSLEWAWPVLCGQIFYPRRRSHETKPDHTRLAPLSPRLHSARLQEQCLSQMDTTIAQHQAGDPYALLCLLQGHFQLDTPLSPERILMACSAGHDGKPAPIPPICC